MLAHRKSSGGREGQEGEIRPSCKCVQWCCRDYIRPTHPPSFLFITNADHQEGLQRTPFVAAKKIPAERECRAGRQSPRSCDGRNSKDHTGRDCNLRAVHLLSSPRGPSRPGQRGTQEDELTFSHCFQLLRKSPNTSRRQVLAAEILFTLTELLSFWWTES